MTKSDGRRMLVCTLCANVTSWIVIGVIIWYAVAISKAEEYSPPYSIQAPAAEAIEPEAAPTPHAEVSRVINLLPKPEVGFVDFGCGADARWCIVAADRWGCKATGIELNPHRAASARQKVREARLEHLVTIVEGDATTTDVKADVGVAYVYQDVLVRLTPRIQKLKSFASYIHRPGVEVVKNGDSWIFTRPATVHAVQRGGLWGGVVYPGPICDNPNCVMCQSLRSQVAANDAAAQLSAAPVTGTVPQIKAEAQPKPQAQVAVPSQPAVRSGYWAKGPCTRRGCSLVWIDTPAQK